VERIGKPSCAVTPRWGRRALGSLAAVVFAALTLASAPAGLVGCDGNVCTQTIETLVAKLDVCGVPDTATIRGRDGFLRGAPSSDDVKCAVLQEQKRRCELACVGPAPCESIAGSDVFDPDVHQLQADDLEACLADCD
jgi:hypothetical protein